MRVISRPQRPMPLRLRLLTGCAMLVVLGACSDFDMDVRDLGNGFDTSSAVAVVTEDRPSEDDRGIISYPSYQVAVARRGDTVADVATRIGLQADELARFNGIPVTAALNRGEILALPTRVAEPSPQTGADATGPIRPTETVDIETLAGSAIERADGGSTAPRPQSSSASSGREPERHKVKRGETAFSIARRYGVPVESLAEWNGLDRELTVREGQYLLIPVTAKVQPTRRAAATPAPGEGGQAPTPPSASAPLPDETTTPVATPTTEDVPASPDLASEATEISTPDARMVAPVGGPIIRDFRKGRNDGIDIAAAAGTPVKAADAGTVAAITRDTDQVPIIVVRHSGGLLTVYANVDNLKVSKGDKVRRGQTLAEVRAGDPAFVHFEVREGVDAVDPSPFLGN